MTTWINLKGVILNERSQSQKVSGCMIPFIWHFQKAVVWGWKIDSLLLGYGVREVLVAKVTWEKIWEWWNCSISYCGGRNMTQINCQIPQDWTVSFMVCKFKTKLAKMSGGIQEGMWTMTNESTCIIK